MYKQYYNTQNGRILSKKSRSKYKASRLVGKPSRYDDFDGVFVSLKTGKPLSKNTRVKLKAPAKIVWISSKTGKQLKSGRSKYAVKKYIPLLAYKTSTTHFDRTIQREYRVEPLPQATEEVKTLIASEPLYDRSLIQVIARIGDKELYTKVYKASLTSPKDIYLLIEKMTRSVKKDFDTELDSQIRSADIQDVKYYVKTITVLPI